MEKCLLWKKSMDFKLSLHQNMLIFKACFTIKLLKRSCSFYSKNLYIIIHKPFSDVLQGNPSLFSAMDSSQGVSCPGVLYWRRNDWPEQTGSHLLPSAQSLVLTILP